MSLIALAIPVFFALIGVEILVAWFQKRRVYRWNDALNDLSCGILQQVLGVFTKAIVYGVYTLLYFEVGHLFEIPQASLAGGVLCFLGVDFLYYWFHRISHRSNLPWGAHVVHHQSEEFNLAVALRQGALQPLFSWVFYLPLALLGFHPLVFLICSSLNTLYQFWIHTRTIGKLGPLEWVLNTPSHHRVHHGCDPKYIDRNYAGTLIIWDRLFGTFQEEEEEPTYGITKPLASWNPLWANLHVYADLWRAGRRAPSWREALRLWLAPPAYRSEWVPDGLGPQRAATPLTHGEAGKYDADAAPGRLPYIVLHFTAAVALTVALIHLAESLEPFEQAGLAVLVAWTVTNIGGLFERRGWAVISELARLTAQWGTGILVATRFEPGIAAVAIGGGALLTGAFMSWLLRSG